MQQFCTCGSVRGASGQLASLPRPLELGVNPLNDRTFFACVWDSPVPAVPARHVVLHVNHVLPCGTMKTNVTLKLDADLLREARVVAAEEGRSISALLTDRLEAIVRERKAFDKARRRALARLREGLDLQWTPPKSRDELHER